MMVGDGTWQWNGYWFLPMHLEMWYIAFNVFVFIHVTLLITDNIGRFWIMTFYVCCGVCARIAGWTTIAWRVLFLCRWLISQHCKSCESLSLSLYPLPKIQHRHQHWKYKAPICMWIVAGACVNMVSSLFDGFAFNCCAEIYQTIISREQSQIMAHFHCLRPSGIADELPSLSFILM